ncbi:flagellar hook capping protein [Nocardioides anomalus]|uniref:Flagellar hook capping protein n=1 Tax=Nocardioides anomalus TaxID=2712223 RepID=A0A6G6WAT9_9ACTN|nr:flagellar hook capping FlgD N-terminal domain-containing protein [Nocardioides anomalus]QIG42461.1 flagellar hook capping protein [Nocardioides anomalus]
MTIGATEGTTAAQSGNGLGVTSTSGSKDKDMFLQLLVAQMKYQDPTNPTDSSQFLAQSAQFTSLEKMESIADQTGLLLGSSLAFGASGLVGRTVTFTLDDGTQGTGVVSGVQFGTSGPVLTVGDHQVPVSNLVSVTDGSAAPTS